MSLLGFVERLDLKSVDLALPHGISFFEPYIRYHIKEALEIGGEAYVSRASEGTVTGVFIYDDFEKTGTIYTRSREVFDHFYGWKRFDFLFAEMRADCISEVYDIYSVDIKGLVIAHRFSHEISMAEGQDADEIERFMAATHPGINRRWVKVALMNGERCVIIRLGDEIGGLGWLSLVNGVGRLHSLYVKPKFRGMAMGEDILYARLMWLKSMHARSAFSEISRNNPPSSRIAVKGHMRVTGQVFLYSRKEPAAPPPASVGSPVRRG
jgi:ribosomal protein S18 acetylase RimI-like enzyme